MPLFMVIWGAVEQYELDAFQQVNRCYGIDHRTFLHDGFYCMFENKNDKEMYSKIITIIAGVSCTSRTVIGALMGSNIPEGVIYYMTWSHIKRYITII